MREPIPLYVLNRFMRFERKIYRIEEIPLPVPIHLKTAMYFFSILIPFAVLVALPGPGTLIRLLPNIGVLFVLIAGPAFLAYVLAGAGTEKRPPVSTLKAIVKYYLRKSKKESYYKGKIMKHPKPVRFMNSSTVRVETIRGNHIEPSDKLSGETHRQELSIQSR